VAIERTAHGSLRATASKAEKRLKKIRLAPTNNGGFVVTHHFHPTNGHGTPSPEVHAFADFDGAHSHLSGLKH
jgi:hypothetical protein